MASKPLALIIGTGPGVSSSLARLLHGKGYDIALAARNTDKLVALAEETHASCYSCDSSNRESVEKLFASLSATPDVMIYNPSYRTRGPVAELDPDEVQKVLQITAFGAFLAAQQAAKSMLARGSGTILFTGASAGVKGYPQSAPFAMGKFAMRGLAQSMARELHPQNIHIGHIVIDGGIKSERRPDEPGADKMLDPDAIAESYWHLIQQPRSSWSWEIEVRPWVEKF